jgi:hypothetical protein
VRPWQESSGEVLSQKQIKTKAGAIVQAAEYLPSMCPTFNFQWRGEEKEKEERKEGRKGKKKGRKEGEEGRAMGERKREREKGKEGKGREVKILCFLSLNFKQRGNSYIHLETYEMFSYMRRGVLFPFIVDPDAGFRSIGGNYRDDLF